MKRTDLERDAQSGLLARDIADQLMGYMALMEMLRGMDQRNVQQMIINRIQREIDKRYR
jgi:hypothetical protein